ncbi:hypothetical protein HBI77_242940 [Parastagonospora nodorum]|nr:hypothetical protein HBI77_242940 [Parastagonospora nodorum]
MHTGLINALRAGPVRSRSSKSVYAVFKYLASSSNLSITTRCANSSSLLRSNSVTIVFVCLTPIKNNNNLLNTINSHIKLRKLKEVRKADALKQRLELEAQLRKASEEEELAKTKKEKREKEAQERKARLDSLLDSNNYYLDSSLDINSKDNLEDEKATTAKNLTRE